MATQVFWQVVNQSYNTALNWANRNGTDQEGAEAAKQQLMMNFGVAIGVSSSLSMGFRTAFDHATFLSPAAKNFGQLVCLHLLASKSCHPHHK